MNRIRHGISAEEWVDWIEGKLHAERADFMSRHIRACRECRLTHDDLILAHGRLEALNRRLAVEDAPLEAAARVHAAVLARLRIGSATEAGDTLEPAVAELRNLVEPLCGGPATDRAMERAAARCSAGLGQLRREQWSQFLAQLSAILEVICGSSVAEWVAATTRDLPWESVV